MKSRTQICLTDAIERALEAESRQTGRSRCQLIREALEKVYLGDAMARAETLVATLEETAGAWSERDYDGEEFVESMRPGLNSRMTLGR